MSSKIRELTVAITGASGSAYGLRLIQKLFHRGVQQHILISQAGRIVIKHETGLDLPDDPESARNILAHHLEISSTHLSCYGINDWFSPAASGSSRIHRMVIVPCSMGCLARIAAGTSDHLIERAADVVLKESGKLIVVPRETPLSSIHLENMLALTRQAVTVMPAMPAFYQKPENIGDLVEFMVDRVLSHLDLSDQSHFQWGR
ncbi:MAG: UbiX family flavin prenyltransferase [Mariprofundaceae bacterium]